MLLVVILVASMGVVVLWLANGDGKLRMILIACAYWAAVSTVALAEELGRKRGGESMHAPELNTARAIG
jgi:hypothetical protein